MSVGESGPTLRGGLGQPEKKPTRGRVLRSHCSFRLVEKLESLSGRKEDRRRPWLPANRIERSKKKGGKPLELIPPVGDRSQDKTAPKKKKIRAERRRVKLFLRTRCGEGEEQPNSGEKHKKRWEKPRCYTRSHRGKRRNAREKQQQQLH